jgi:hypothetical protein
VAGHFALNNVNKVLPFQGRNYVRLLTAGRRPAVMKVTPLSGRIFLATKLFALAFSFTFACLVFGRQALTLLNR